MAAALEKVGTGAGVFHQQTIVFRWAAASIGGGHFDSWPAAEWALLPASIQACEEQWRSGN
jgi:hypothetical protein